MTREEKAERNEEIRRYKAEGHTHKETAEKFGLSKGTVQQIARGIAPQTERRPDVYRNQWSSRDQTDRVAAIISERANGFEYAGSYTGSDGTADLMCKKCGNIITRSWVSIRHNDKRGHVRCPVCYEQKVEENKRIRENKKRLNALAKEQARMDKILSMKAEQLALKTCPMCGEMFVGQNKYCSSACSKKKRNQKDKRLKRRKAMVDKDISLQALARRDGDVCYLCGEPVDWSDIEDRGYCKVAGEYYPSIDHVVPLAAGGKHSWDNVRLAHRRCNSLKSDTVMPPIKKTGGLLIGHRWADFSRPLCERDGQICLDLRGVGLG
jgi:5-methylcytosine-specific restriction endonuclease McrA